MAGTQLRVWPLLFGRKRQMRPWLSASSGLKFPTESSKAPQSECMPRRTSSEINCCNLGKKHLAGSVYTVCIGGFLDNCLLRGWWHRMSPLYARPTQPKGRLGRLLWWQVCQGLAHPVDSALRTLMTITAGGTGCSPHAPHTRMDGLCVHDLIQPSQQLPGRINLILQRKQLRLREGKWLMRSHTAKGGRAGLEFSFSMPVPVQTLPCSLAGKTLLASELESSQTHPHPHFISLYPHSGPCYESSPSWHIAACVCLQKIITLPPSP